MRLVRILAGLVVVGIAVWGVAALVDLPGSFAVAAGAPISIALVAATLLVVGWLGIRWADGTATTYW